jgi:integrase
MDPITDASSLAGVIVRIQQDAELTAARRRDLVSSVLRVSAVTGVDPRSAPASLRFMRPLINAVHPAKHNLSPKTWSNLRSNFRAALIQKAPRPRKQADPEWSKLRGRLPTKRMRLGLSRFISFCEDAEIAPKAVSDAVSCRFRAYLEADTHVPDPQACHRTTCRLWNLAVEAVSGWPSIRLSVPDHRGLRRSTPLTNFPLRLQKEFAEYIRSLRDGDLFAEEVPQRALAPSTVRQRAVELGLALSALVASGRDPASITRLACLVEPSAFAAILRRYLKDNKPRPFAHNIAYTLITLAARWVRVDSGALDKLRQLQKRLGPQRKGLTEKNRTLLRTLDDREVRARLLFLPERLANWAERAKPDRGAIAMRTAVAVVMLQSVPLRISNLAGLRFDQHLARPGGPRSLWQIEIPQHEVKNNQPLVHELPRRATALVDSYIRRFRPILAAPDNPYLFPAGSRDKRPHGFSQQVRGVLAQLVGIHMTPHQFRHFAGRLVQQHSPGAFATIAHLLGHKDVRTAITYYAGLDTLSAGRHFDEILEAELRKLRSLDWRRT